MDAPRRRADEAGTPPRVEGSAAQADALADERAGVGSAARGGGGEDEEIDRARPEAAVSTHPDPAVASDAVVCPRRRSVAPDPGALDDRASLVSTRAFRSARI
jgi:hypothetical protein